MHHYSSLSIICPVFYLIFFHLAYFRCCRICILHGSQRGMAYDKRLERDSSIVTKTIRYHMFSFVIPANAMCYCDGASYTFGSSVQVHLTFLYADISKYAGNILFTQLLGVSTKLTKINLVKQFLFVHLCLYFHLNSIITSEK